MARLMLHISWQADRELEELEELEDWPRAPPRHSGIPLRRSGARRQSMLGGMPSA